MEDYKKKYEEAMLRMTKWVESSEIAVYPKGVAAFVFPELKENDELIRKGLLQWLRLKLKLANPPVGSLCEEMKEWIAWVEKQDPKKNEEELEKAYKTADEVQYKKGYEDAKREFEKQGEQKPAWSEEDDDNIMMIEDRLSDYLDYIREDITLTKFQKNCLKEKVIGYVNWLKSLKERMKGE